MGKTSAQRPSDGALFVSIGQGDPTALRLLMDRYDRLVRYTVYRASRQRCRRDPLWLDSVASEVWSDLCRSARRGGIPKLANVPSFFIQIARRRCIDALRRRGETPLGSEIPEGFDQLEPSEPQEDTLGTLAGLEELAALRTCMGELPEEGRCLCGEIAAITSGQWREAARRLGIPESTLRSRWAGVVGRLRKCMRKRQESSRA